MTKNNNFCRKLSKENYAIFTAGFRSVQTIQLNRVQQISGPHVLKSNYFFWFFWPLFLHQCPLLHPQKGIAKQQKVKEKGSTWPHIGIKQDPVFVNLAPAIFNMHSKSDI